jgi:hypothetical protein
MPRATHAGAAQLIEAKSAQKECCKVDCVFERIYKGETDYNKSSLYIRPTDGCCRSL